MSFASNYFLAGKYFARTFSLSRENSVVKNSLQLFRLPENLYDWYLGKNGKDFPNDQVTQIASIGNEALETKLKLFSEPFNHNILYYECNYIEIKKFSRDEVNTYKFDIEQSFQNHNINKNLTKHFVSKDLLLDSLLYHPVIENDPKTSVLKSMITKSLFPKLKLDKDIVIISGEMIWSGWLTLNVLLDLIPFQKKTQTLVIIDVWGIFQQFLCNENLFREISSLKDLYVFIEEVSLSILLVNKQDDFVKNISSSRHSTTIKGLFMNSDIVKNYPQEISHKPDYIFIQERQKQTSKYIPLGMEINHIEELPLSILGKSQLKLNLLPDTLLQKDEGVEVLWGEDIGQSPVMEEKFTRIKLPKQVVLSVKTGQQINKGDVIGTRSIFKGLMKEKVISLTKGRINSNYFGLGLLKYDIKIGTEVLNAPFEGRIEEVRKSKFSTEILINAYTYTVYPTYFTGLDISGKLVTLGELKTVVGEKILLVKKDSLGQINKELIIKNNIVGVIIISLDYLDLKKFTQRLVEDKIYLTTVVLNPFSIKQFEEQNEILFLYTTNTVVLTSGRVVLLLAKNELKNIYLRLRSKKEKSDKPSLMKGDEIMIFNYSLQDRYARIEKLSKKNIILSTTGGLITTNLNNISKFTITELNAEQSQ